MGGEGEKGKAVIEGMGMGHAVGIAKGPVKRGDLGGLHFEPIEAAEKNG